MKGAPEGIECVARFFDDQETASKVGFKAAWVGFLRSFNVFQFLPRSWFVTSRGLEANAYAALTDTISRKAEPKPAVDDPNLAELLDLSAPEVRSLLRLISHEGLPLPEPGYELPGAVGEVIATAELAWPSLKLALLLDSEAHSEAIFAEAHWTTRRFSAVRENLQEFLALLHAVIHRGGSNAN